MMIINHSKFDFFLSFFKITFKLRNEVWERCIWFRHRFHQLGTLTKTRWHQSIYHARLRCSKFCCRGRRRSCISKTHHTANCDELKFLFIFCQQLKSNNFFVKKVIIFSLLKKTYLRWLINKTLLRRRLLRSNRCKIDCEHCQQHRINRQRNQKTKTMLKGMIGIWLVS